MRLLWHVRQWCVVLSLGATAAVAQPLSLVELFRAAQVNNPDLRSARLAAEAAGHDVAAMERLRWPNLSLTAESDTGNSRSAANTAMQVEQIVWDFGHTDARIAGAQSEERASLVRLQLQQQDIELQLIGAWQALLGAQQRAHAASRTLVRLQGFVAQMTRRVQAELSAPIDLELVQARVLQTEVELASAQNTLQVATHRLEQLSGLTGLAARVISLPEAIDLGPTQAFGVELGRIDLAHHARQSTLVAKARLDTEKARIDVEMIRAQLMPTVYLRSQQPLSRSASGFDVNTSMTTFLGLRYSPGAGFATAVQAQAAQVRLISVQERVESAFREMEQILRTDREEFFNAQLRLGSLAQSVQGSARVLESYKSQYEANRKTWLDLMNAVRELAQNEYALAEAQTVQLGAQLRLQVRLQRPLQ